MYFWRIESLKRELAARAVSEGAALPYLLWLGALTTFTASLPWGEANRWDVATASAGVALFVGGTLYAFRCNGGAAGSDFLVRYVSINWVLSVRLLALLLIPGVVALIALEELLLDEPPSSSTAIDFGLVTSFEAIFYWRLVAHVREVAASAVGPRPAGQPR